jgi:hypothetical protein
MPKLTNTSIISRFCTLKYYRQSTRKDGVYQVAFVEDRCNIYRRNILEKYPFNTDFRISGEDQDVAYQITENNYKIIYDSALKYEAALSNQQNSYYKVLKHERDYAISQVSLNLKHWKTIRSADNDPNLKSRMRFRLLQLINSIIALILLSSQSWYLFFMLIFGRYLYSIYSYSRIHKNLFDNIIFSVFELLTDFAYFSGVVYGIGLNLIQTIRWK